MLAFACLVAIIAVLAIFQGKPLPSWPKMMSINSMVAVFTAIMKAALVVPLTQG
jgi:hypothetical protein